MAIDNDALESAEGSFDDDFDETTADFGDDVEAGQADDEVQGSEADDDVADDAEAAEGEDDAPDDAEGDEVEPDDEVDDEPAAKREPMLPKSRYDSVRRRLRQAEERLAAMEKAPDSQPDTEADTGPTIDEQMADLNKQFAQATLDSDADKMSELNVQMMNLQSQKFEQMLADSRNGVISESRDSVITDNLVDELVENHAELNPDSEAFDQTLVARIEEFRAFYESKGFTESEALVKSVEVAMPQAFEARDTTSSQAKQKANSLAKKVAAANGQPPSTKRTGEDGPTYGRGRKVDMSKMTLDDLDDLTEAEWDEALGNNFAG